MRTEFKRLGCVGNWDDPYLTLSKDYEATIARQLAGFVDAAAGLPRQEAGPLVLRPPDRAGRGGGRIRGPHVAVDLRPLPDRGRPGQGRSAPARQARGVRHLDDDALDAAREPGGRRQPGARLRRHPARRRVPDRRGRTGRGLPRGDRHRRPAGLVDPDLDATGCARWRERSYTPPFPRPSGGRAARLPPLVRPARHARGGHRPGPHRARPRRGGLRRRPRARAANLRAGRRSTADSRTTLRNQCRTCAGMKVFDANPIIVDLLSGAGCCSTSRARQSSHQYPHCWRCHNPIIFRATEQWFARLGDAADEKSLRHAGARRDRAHPVDPGLGPEPHPRHDRGAPRLVPVAPARVGRPDPGVPLHRVREGSARRQGYRARGRHLRARGLERLVLAPRGRAAAGACADVLVRRPAVRQAERHRRRLVRIGRVVGGGGGGQAGAGGREGRPLPGGGGPAPRLVPLVAADVGSDARPGAVQGGPDARLGARRARQAVFQVRHREGARGGREGYLRRSRGLDGEERRRAAAAVDGGLRLPGRRRLLRHDPGQLGESYRKIRNTCRYLLSNLYDFVPVARSAGGSRAARAGSAGAGRAARARPPGLRRLQALRVPRGRTDDERLLHHRVGRIPRPDQGRALLRGVGLAGAAQRADRRATR